MNNKMKPRKGTSTSHQRHLRAGSDYGQTSSGEGYGPMKMHKCPKYVLSAFTLEAEVQRTPPSKEPRWQHFSEVMTPRVRPLEQSFHREAKLFFITIFKI